METVNNIASAASKAIWGDPEKAADTPQTDEPRSGETGDVKAGEPFDKGNKDPSSTTSNETTNLTSSSVTDTNTNTATTDTPLTTNDLPGSTSTTLPVRSEHESSKTGVTLPNNPTSVTSTDKPTTSNETYGAVPAASVDAADAGPSSKPLTELNKDGGLQKETKGISPETPSSANTSNKIESTQDEDTDESPSGGKLKGLKEKIKAKLHKH